MNILQLVIAYLNMVVFVSNQWILCLSSAHLLQKKKKLSWKIVAEWLVVLPYYYDTSMIYFHKKPFLVNQKAEFNVELSVFHKQ